MHQEGLGDLRAHAPNGVETERRILRHETHDAAADRAPPSLAEAAQALSIERGLAARDLGIGGEQVHDRLRDGALSGSRFADDRDDLAAAHREIDAADGLHLAVADAVADTEAFDAQNRVGELFDHEASSSLSARAMMLTLCRAILPINS